MCVWLPLCGVCAELCVRYSIDCIYPFCAWNVGERSRGRRRVLTTVVLVENVLLSVVKQTLLHFWMAYLLLGIIFLAVLLKRYWQIEKTSAPLSVEGCVVFATCWGNSAKQAGKKKKISEVLVGWCSIICSVTPHLLLCLVCEHAFSVCTYRSTDWSILVAEREGEPWQKVLSTLFLIVISAAALVTIDSCR